MSNSRGILMRREARRLAVARRVRAGESQMGSWWDDLINVGKDLIGDAAKAELGRARDWVIQQAADFYKLQTELDAQQRDLSDVPTLAGRSLTVTETAAYSGARGLVSTSYAQWQSTATLLQTDATRLSNMLAGSESMDGAWVAQEGTRVTAQVEAVRVLIQKSRAAVDGVRHMVGLPTSGGGGITGALAGSVPWLVLAGLGAATWFLVRRSRRGRRRVAG